MKLKLGLVATVMTALLLICAVDGAIGAQMILNEYNAVKDAGFLKGGASDPYFGTVAGNGGDWMEFVVIQDNLDLRGWCITTLQNGDTDSTIVLPSTDTFACLRSGTILTIAENVANDFSYNPIYDANNPDAGDWWINYQASFSSGDNSQNNFQAVITDAQGNIIFGPAGEGISPLSGVGSDEVFKLEADPSDSITADSPYYKDGTSSTFGSPNKYNSGTQVQDFSKLRSCVVPEPASALALIFGIAPLVIRKRRHSA